MLRSLINVYKLIHVLQYLQWKTFSTHCDKLIVFAFHVITVLQIRRREKEETQNNTLPSKENRGLLLVSA